MKRVDTLILGQGLSGSLLAWTLVQAGETVMVVDDAAAESASRVAAGVINPITGKRLVKAWSYEEYLAVARRMYGELEQALSIDCFKDLVVQRVLASEREREVWSKKKDDPVYADFLGQCEADVVTVRGAAMVHCRKVVEAVAAFLQQRDSLRQEAWSYEDVVFTEEGVRYGDVLASRLVCAEGYRVQENPWFADLPLKPSLGELVSLPRGEEDWQDMLNGGKWLVPGFEDEFLVGATYAWDWDAVRVSAEGKEVLQAAAEQLAERAGIVLPSEDAWNWRAGVRPTSDDARPWVGRHPQQKRLWIFNGFSSKGALYIPHCAEQLCRFWQEGVPVDAQVNVARVYYTALKKY